jgi:hypothetical protein
MNKSIRSWKEALIAVNLESLLGCAIEIWYWPQELVQASEKKQEFGREVFRCVIENIDKQIDPPFKTSRWVKFDKSSNSWKPTASQESLLIVTGACLSGIHISSKGIVQRVSPTLNTHLIFYRQDEQVPHNPGQPLSSEEFDALLR